MNIFKNLSFQKVFPWVLIIGGVIGLTASGILTIEKINIAADPNYNPSCSISPIVACSPVIASDQASAFGFPNPFLGLAGFGMVWAVGMMVLAGAKNLKKWFWLAFQAGSLFGIFFIGWLIYHSLYEIGKLCIYCMLVWSVTIPIFWSTLAFNIQEKNIKPLCKVGKFVGDNPGKIITISYLIVILLVFLQFQDYWYSLI
jgi:uncharacterized membrane protein